MTVCSLDFAFLSARFSLSDFPDFFDMDLRGDLSDIIGPSIGNLNGPDASTVRHIQLVPRLVDQHFMTIAGEVLTQAGDHINRRNVRRPLGGDSQDTPNKRSNKQDRARWLFWAGASALSRPSSARGGKKNRKVMA